MPEHVANYLTIIFAIQKFLLEFGLQVENPSGCLCIFYEHFKPREGQMEQSALQSLL
jgi:hypothetical protein